MTGPDIFANMIVNMFSLFFVVIILTVFMAKIIPKIFSSATPLRLFEMLKVIVILLPIFIAFASLFNYVDFNLIWWIYAEVFLISIFSFLELFWVNLKGPYADKEVKKVWVIRKKLRKK